jgi:hypothetical protein
MAKIGEFQVALLVYQINDPTPKIVQNRGFRVLNLLPAPSPIFWFLESVKLMLTGIRRETRHPVEYTPMTETPTTKIPQFGPKLPTCGFLSILHATRGELGSETF